MRRFLALILVFGLWFGFTAPAARADFSFNALTTCSQSSAFKERQAAAVGDAAKARFDKYSTMLCGDEGLPHLIADGRFDHAGEFLIPSVLFLYIAGWIGWAGRSYLKAIRAESYDSALEKEIIIDLPKALASSLAAAMWPLLALQEFGSGALVAPEKEVPVSPR